MLVRVKVVPASGRYKWPKRTDKLGITKDGRVKRIGKKSKSKYYIGTAEEDYDGSGEIICTLRC